MGSDPGRMVASPALRKKLLSIGALIAKGEGTVLFRRGDPCVGVFLICKGRVRLALDDTDALFPPRVLHEGCVLGLPSAVGGSSYSLTAEVVEKAELACVSQQALTDCLRLNAQLCFEVMSLLGHEVAEARTVIKQSAGVRPHNGR